MSSESGKRGGALALLVGTLLLAGAAGCRGCADASWAPEEEAPEDVEVREEALAIKSGKVGHGRWETKASYVLVDAVNTGERDLKVTLTGTLESAAGEELGELRSESLRVPAGGQRTFALVDSAEKTRPDAEGASIELAGAAVVTYPPPLRMRDEHVYRDRDHEGRERVVVAGRVINTAEGRGRFLVIAGFYGENDVPMKRPFAVLDVEGGESRPVRFVGPPGSEAGYLFIGPSSF